MIRTNKHFLAVAITVVAMSAVLATAITTASLGATAAATATKLRLSVSNAVLYAGDSVTGSGRLVDANGEGIPNQVIYIKWQVSIKGRTFNGKNDTQTDASGNFGQTITVPSSGIPSSITQATVKLTAVYNGNAQYAACQSSPVMLTVHFQ
jgi:hypothetical protein